ncbi:nuclear transport factor 2 family protein [Bacteroidota bacterium]
MKKSFLIVTLFLAVTTFSQAQSNEKDIEAIKEVIQTAYVEGLQNEGDVEKIDSGIHPKFNLIGIDKGNDMWVYSITDWKANTVKKVKDGKLPKKEEEKVTIKFLNVDVTGTAAMAKIEFYVGKKLTYVDYISLYKFEDGWKMVNKIFYKL